jgi:Cu/Ag efflux protein CusF
MYLIKDRITLTLFAVMLGGLLFISCGKKSQEAAATDTTTTTPQESANIDHGETTGRIVKMSEDKRELTIAHADIGDWMSAMTMSFAVHDPAMVSGYAVGDSIRFTVIEEKDGLSIGKISKE